MKRYRNMTQLKDRVQQSEQTLLHVTFIHTFSQ